MTPAAPRRVNHLKMSENLREYCDNVTRTDSGEIRGPRFTRRRNHNDTYQPPSQVLYAHVRRVLLVYGWPTYTLRILARTMLIRSCEMADGGLCTASGPARSSRSSLKRISYIPLGSRAEKFSTLCTEYRINEFKWIWETRKWMVL